MLSLPDPNLPWPERAFELALNTVDNDVLVKAAGQHVQPEGEWTDGKIRPSLLSIDCDLQTVKRYRGHHPQPNAPWMAARQGRPSAGSNLAFARGFLGEGMVVAGLKLVADYLGYEVIGCAPEFVFEADPDFQAHPDFIALVEGQIELVQIKCPSVFAFDRYDKGKSDLDERYLPQVAGEMAIGRRMGLPVERGWIFLFTWEGWPPSVKEHRECRIICKSYEWDAQMDHWLDQKAALIRMSAMNAERGIWPHPVNRENEFDKWPCSYCQYARTPAFAGQAKCDENERWEVA